MNLRFEIWDLRFEIWDLRFEIWDLRFRISDFGFEKSTPPRNRTSSHCFEDSHANPSHPQGRKRKKWSEKKKGSELRVEGSGKKRAGWVGLEPTRGRLTGACSATELPTRIKVFRKKCSVFRKYYELNSWTLNPQLWTLLLKVSCESRTRPTRVETWSLTDRPRTHEEVFRESECSVFRICYELRFHFWSALVPETFF